MRKLATLKTRIIYFFCGYLAILLMVYSGALFGMLHINEDQLFKRQVKNMADIVERSLEETGKLPNHLPNNFAAYEGLSNVPSELKGYIADLRPGYHEIDSDGLDYHVEIIDIAARDRILYVFYDVRSFETTEIFDTLIVSALISAGLIVLAIGWSLAKSVSNRILNPIVKLAQKVRSLSPDDLTTRLHYDSTKDEVGTLVDTINRLLERVSDFTTREREFTAHASHELRTPVTVIQGAVEVIRNRSGEETIAIEKPLSRIERAVSEMDKLIEIFLLLARQGQTPDEDKQCDLSATVRKVVDSCRYILGNKPVDVNLILPDSLIVQAPESLVSITVGNLVRNSFMYTSEGKVDISVHEDRVVISDNGPGIDPAQKGKGLGLTIVKRLCERMKWGFNITSHAGEGTRVELFFNHDLLKGDTVRLLG